MKESMRRALVSVWVFKVKHFRKAKSTVSLCSRLAAGYRGFSCIVPSLLRGKGCGVGCGGRMMSVYSDYNHA